MRVPTPPRDSSLHRRLVMVGMTSTMATVLVLGSLAAFDVREQQRLRTATTRVLEEQRIGDDVMRDVMRQLSIAGDPGSRASRSQLAAFAQTGDSVHRHLRTYLFRSLSREERRQIELVKEEHQRLEVAARRVMQAAPLASDTAEDPRVEMMRHAFQLLEALRGFVTMREQALESLSETQAATMRRMTIAGVLFMSLLALIQGLAIARFVRRRVTRPLEDVSDAVTRVGAGDLNVRLPAAADREFTGIVGAVNGMASSLTTARDEIVRRESLAAIGRMTAGLAHELNNPLATVLASSELLAARLDESAPLDADELERDYVTPIVQESRRARLLVRSLLQFARRGHSEIGAVPFRDSLAIIVELRQFACTAAGVRLVVDPVPAVHVQAERQQLEAVLLNVLNNAIDAVAPRGDGTVHLRTRVDDGMLVVRVDDDGPGMHDPSRVFEAFYTTKDVGEGTGLGLALVERFMTAFGGSVTAENKPEGGAQFTLRFRVVAPEEPSPGVASVPDAAMAPAPDTAGAVAPALLQSEVRAASRPCVLVVDDEPALVRAQQLLLRRLQVDVVTADSVRAAQDVLRETTVHAVLCDVKMPAASGLLLYEWIARAMPALATRFIFVTGDVEAPELATFARERPDAVLAKPFDVREYLARVQAVLDPGHPAFAAPSAS